MAMGSVRKLQVFVSSTFLDLRAERQAAVTAILENGHIPAGMELFADGSEEQLEVIHRWIDESDIFLLILGRRYGSLEPKNGLSYIQSEYQYAVERGTPFFAVVLSDAFIEGKIRAGSKVDDLIETEEPEKFKDFQSMVTSRMCKFVDDEKDIRLAVAQSIRYLERRHDFAGWISARDSKVDTQLIADLGSAAKLAASLQERNSSLEQELQALRVAAARKSVFDGRTFEEVCKMLQGQHVKLTLEGKKVDIDLLTAARHFKTSLAAGVDNSAGAGEFGSMLFWNVASPLLVHGLVERGKVPVKAYWQRLQLSPLGGRFLTELEARVVKTQDLAQAKPSPVSRSATDASKLVPAPPEARSAVDGAAHKDRQAIANKPRRKSRRERSATPSN